jgi:hypothetical protein
VNRIKDRPAKIMCYRYDLIAMLFYLAGKMRGVRIRWYATLGLDEQNFYLAGQQMIAGVRFAIRIIIIVDSHLLHLNPEEAIPSLDTEDVVFGKITVLA